MTSPSRRRQIKGSLVNLTAQEQLQNLVLDFSIYVGNICSATVQRFEQNANTLMKDHIEIHNLLKEENVGLLNENLKLHEQNRQYLEQISKLQIQNETLKRRLDQQLQLNKTICDKTNMIDNSVLSLQYINQSIESKGSNDLAQSNFKKQDTKHFYKCKDNFTYQGVAQPQNHQLFIYWKDKIQTLKHKKKSIFDVETTNRGILFTKISQTKSWNIAQICPLPLKYEDKIFSFKVHKLSKTNLGVGLGIREELDEHNWSKKQNIFVYSPYNGEFRGHKQQNSEQNHLEKSEAETQLKISKNKVIWQNSREQILYSTDLTEKMKKSILIVFIALRDTKDAIQLLAE